MPSCTNCGSFVTPSFVRVFGGNDGEVRGCDSCMTQTELNSGIAARTSSAGVSFEPNEGPGDPSSAGDGPPEI